MFSYFYRILLFLLLSFSGVLQGKAQPAANNSATKPKLRFVHSIELGALFRTGRENVFTRNSFDNTLQKNRTYIIGKYAQHFALRFSHGIAFKQYHEAGICYGADIYFQKAYSQALMPLMVYYGWQAPVKWRVKPFITQRVGYAFYFRNRQHEPLLTYTGIEGGAAAETVLGISFTNKKKVRAQIAVLYRFQHLRSTAIYHTQNSLANSYGLFTNLPSTVTEVSNGLYHFIGFSVGIKF